MDWKLIYADGYDEFRRVFNTGSGYRIALEFISSVPGSPLVPKCPFKKNMEATWPNLSWYKLIPAEGELYPNRNCFPKRHAVARLETKQGIFWAMRNGINKGRYNMVVYSVKHNRFWYEYNIAKTIKLLQILSTDDLPMLVGQALSPKHLTLLEQRLKGEL